ncbi:succinate dehydrogenase, cytochrome b556 subunit [Candidatus Venteria ishoeyi]|uniref:succinate dehydrogenase, cytochrome b556 subunit n=1 Tax=Candidatus Venteria ishoeyi TaxID=1899563 RepID=UPI0025A564EB|nr:succinate dehydrogenase, cytochrome b556 subunit [Candidatus Venteria ishoeyi]MDM8545728.1 succinate dehydrogenase, cytochrome b556 subunit [Candidatus Venteria ishoeyi]
MSQLRPMRPLSPHLQIYHLPLTAKFSIIHRASGIILSLGLPLWLYALYCLTQGEAVWHNLQVYLLSGFGVSALMVYVFCLFYHLCNGIRHLFWDMNLGLDLKTAKYSNWAVLLGSLGLTLVVFLGA